MGQRKKIFVNFFVFVIAFLLFTHVIVKAKDIETGWDYNQEERLEYEISPYVILADGETLPQTKVEDASVLSEDVVQLDTEEALYQYLKEQLVARNSQITVSVPVEIDNKVGPVNAMTSAEEYTESCSGQEGDALKYGGVGYNISTRGYTARVTYTYYMNYFSTAEQEEKLTNAVKSALKSLNVDEKTDEEREFAIKNNRFIKVNLV